MPVSADSPPMFGMSATETSLTVRPPLPPSTASAPSTCSASVSVSTTAASLTVMPVIWPILASITESAPNARSAWICAAVSLSVIETSALRPTRAAICASDAAVTVRLPGGNSASASITRAASTPVSVMELPSPLAKPML